MARDLWGREGGLTPRLTPPPRPSTGASGGRCAAAHAVWDGRPVRALPPPPPQERGGDDDTGGS